MKTLEEKLKVIAEFVDFPDFYFIKTQEIPISENAPPKIIEVPFDDISDIDYNMLMPVWFKFRELHFSSDNINFETNNRGHLEHCIRISAAITGQPISVFFERMHDAIVWYNSIKDRK